MKKTTQIKKIVAIYIFVAVARAKGNIEGYIPHITTSSVGRGMMLN